ncbi:hypothetical protein NW762_011592 [Fusarium torreyae]|uniref:Major facilitator superfamily (MFS) profile domain-containing protein n=1 Tax=Fusarium torreyae TaxID=1237075 RepID=A0A9W8RRX6_9HYPO|nr:hypothetical protein NW762_011592 [Fusarium torreyae]
MSDQHKVKDAKADHLEAIASNGFPEGEAILQDVSYGPNGIRGIVSSPFVFGAAFLASLGGFSFGYDQGVISIINVMPHFHEAFPPAKTAFGTGFMTGMLLLGAFVGCPFMPYLADKISRKWALTVVVVILDIGAIIQTAANSYGMLVAGRAIGGIGVGTLAMGAPLYISEISPPNLRDTLLVLESISIVSGVVIAYWITFATRDINSEVSFRLPFGLQMAEYKSIITEVEFQKLIQEAKYPGQFSGINAFIYYAPTLFRSIGQSDEMSLILSGVFNILQLVAVAVCFVVIDRVGRRPLAIVGGFGTAAYYAIIAILSGLYSKDWQANTAAGWACVAMAFAFLLVFGVSYSPLGWALPPEVFSTSQRAKGVALATCVNWLSNFTVGIATPPMLELICFGAYIFFACFCAMAGIWAFFLVPETIGRTLEQMDEVFGDTSGSEEIVMMMEAARIANTLARGDVTA